MKKNFLIITSMIFLLQSITLTAYAGVDSFSKGFGYDCYNDVKNYQVTASSLGIAGETFEDTVVGKDDTVLIKSIPSNALNNYKQYANGVDNVYTWAESSTGELTKIYGKNFNGFIGHKIGDEVAVGYTTTPIINARTSEPLGLGKGGSYVVRPRDNDVNFGRYDLNLLDNDEVSKFTFIFATNNGIPNSKMLFVQDENASTIKECVKEYQIFEIASNGSSANVKIGENDFVNTAIPKGGFGTKDLYYVIEFWLDTRNEVPMCKVGFKNYVSTEYIDETDWFSIADANFDFCSDMGIKLLSHGHESKINGEYHIAEFKLEKVAPPLAITTTQEQLNEMKVPVSGGSVNFEFSRELKVQNIVNSNVIVTDENGTDIGATVSANGKIVTVQFPKLKPASIYTINFNQIPPVEGEGYSGIFTIMSTDIAELLSLSSEVVDNKVDLSIKLKHYSDEKQNYILLATLNNGNNMLQGVYYLPIEIDKIGEQTYTISGIDNKSNYGYKVYLIDNFNNMFAITDEIAK